MSEYPWRSNVRVEDGIWYLRCDECARAQNTTAFWPIGDEHWDVAKGLQRCRGCHRARRRRADHATAEFQRARERRYYVKHRERRRAYARTYYAKHADRINAERRIKRNEGVNDRAA